VKAVVLEMLQDYAARTPLGNYYKILTVETHETVTVVEQVAHVDGASTKHNCDVIA
jgi:hypothetical protein